VGYYAENEENILNIFSHRGYRVHRYFVFVINTLRLCAFAERVYEPDIRFNRYSTYYFYLENGILKSWQD